MKKMTKKEEAAHDLKIMQQNYPDILVALRLNAVMEPLEWAISEIAPAKPVPAQVEALAIMQRALSELQAVVQKYYPDDLDQAA